MKTELSTNHFKITNWALQAHLAGVDYINIAFVSREDVKSNNNHIIYGIHQTVPKQLLAQSNFNYHVGWGMIKNLADILLSCEDGNYVLMKSLAGPKQLVKLFRLKSVENIEEI